MTCATTPSLSLYIGNTNVVELEKLTNSVDNLPVTDATVTVRIQDDQGVDVPGEVFPASMGHVADGTYQATLSHNMTLLYNHPYTALVVATGTGGQVAQFSCPVVAKIRKCS